MASFFEDTSQWRLRTEGGIPYKLIKQEGKFEEETGSSTVDVMIESSRLRDFVEELLPQPELFAQIFFVTLSTTLPAFPEMVLRSITYKSQDDGLPIDPFGADEEAPTGTYHPVLLVTLSYDTDSKKKETNPNDPSTFLEISGDATGQFITAPMPGAVLAPPDARANGEWLGSAHVPAGGNINIDGVAVAVEAAKNPNVTQVVIVPETNWTLRWNQCPYDLFKNRFITILRNMMGKVNSVAFAPLFDANPETLLFLGYNYEEKYTWREGLIERPPCVLTLKMFEKHVTDRNGFIIGHNHVWDPGVGWRRPILANGETQYLGYDFNRLFSLEA